jgi:hypothetical protein
MDNYSHQAIFHRFRRALLTHEQPVADIQFRKASELVPEIEAEFGDDLMDFEMFLLAGVLANMREIERLKERIEIIQIHPKK